MELSRNLIVESVSRLGPTPPRQVEVDRAVADAVAAMRQYRVGCLLVTQGGKLVGIFTERDLLTRVLAASLPLTTPLRACMTPDPIAVGPKDPVRVAIERMQTGSYRHLPVVDGSNRPIGILSAKRVVRYIVEHFPATVYCLPPDPHNNFPASAEGA
ncbi:cyclic nucleotide-binding/CBS domain-containing protein [Fimbriiglobus ruber]|uniref:CBS domain protein n=1 Tax=Fimbriiglobus ruber TaxID=1908690 RepID=A0A225DTZ4_9BACT|nr:CBS domain-containing protein [Fimbriiglobus ruber]OWK44513.1 CBS domain protein [Fimbriiglobus ruber]